MALTWLHALWIDVLADGHQQTARINWLMVVTLEAWQVISAWFIAHQSPPGRHMVAIAHWMETLLTEAFLPVVQQISTQVEHRQQQQQLQQQPQQQQQQLVQSSVPLVLIAATLQSAIQFFHVCLTMLKPLHHGPRNVTCTLEALAFLVKERPHLWASSSPSTDTAAQPPPPPPPQPDDPSSLSMETSPGWLQPTYWRQTIQDHVLPSFLTEVVWHPLLVYEAKR
eukprot:gene19426-14064_t